LFPLQAALAYAMMQGLPGDEHALLVARPSDMLYLQAFSSELAARGRRGLDRRWAVSPVNGVDRVAAFLNLFAAAKPHAAILLDIGADGMARADRLKRSKLLEEGHVFAIAEFAGQDEAEIEDLLGPELYVQTVNAALHLGEDRRPTLDQVNALAPETTRIVPKVEAAFKAIGADGVDFDRHAPAAWLIEHPAELRGEGRAVTAALERFELLFGRLNALLPAKRTTLFGRLARR